VNAATATALVPSLRDRLAVIIGSLKFTPQYSHPADSCAECRQARADAGTLGDATGAAQLAVYTAPTDAAAMAAYFDFFAALGGLKGGVR
jgi:hypothetical protein